VIGAGVLGAALAARLAELGTRVTLLEADGPGRATTRWSLAWLNANEKTPRAYHDLNAAGIAAWARLARSLEGESWFRPVGNLEWAVTRDAGDRLAARVHRLAEWGYAARPVDARTAADLAASYRLPSGITAAAWFPDEGYVLTEPLVDRLVERAVECGATVLTGAAGRVVELPMDGGTVRAVRTASGESIGVDVAVCCAGRWTPALAASAGADGAVRLLPWESPGATAPGLVVRAGPCRPALRRMAHAPDVVVRPHPEGLVHLEALDAAVDLHTPEAELRRWADELLSRARRLVPGLRDAEVVEHRVCVRPMPVDGHPVVGWLPGVGGAYVVVTHSGVTLGAHLARLVATEIVDGAEAAELAPYRPGRFG